MATGQQQKTTSTNTSTTAATAAAPEPAPANHFYSLPPQQWMVQFGSLLSSKTADIKAAQSEFSYFLIALTLEKNKDYINSLQTYQKGADKCDALCALRLAEIFCTQNNIFGVQVSFTNYWFYLALSTAFWTLQYPSLQALSPLKHFQALASQYSEPAELHTTQKFIDEVYAKEPDKVKIVISLLLLATAEPAKI